MPLPVAAIAGLAGSLLGGGTQISTNTTVSSANTNTFNPSIVFGGDSNFIPSAPVTNDFVSSASSSQLQEQADPSDLLSLLNPTSAAGDVLGAISPLISGGAAGTTAASVTPTAFAPTASPVSTPLVFAGLAAAVVVGVVVFKPTKKGR